MKLKALFENEFYYMDDEADTEFSALQVVSRMTPEEGEKANLKFLGTVYAPEDSYRPGAEELKVYVNSKGKVVVKDVLSGEGEFDVLDIVPMQLDNYFG